MCREKPLQQRFISRAQRPDLDVLLHERPRLRLSSLRDDRGHLPRELLVEG
jgi:hypothetical protein